MAKTLMHCVANCNSSVQLHAGVFRTDEILSKGVREIMAIAERVKRTEIKDKSKVWNTRVSKLWNWII